jgi:hypothetical protein
MRDDPYPARYYGPWIDEPAMTTTVARLPYQTSPLPQALSRLLIIVLTLYLLFAAFFIFTVSSYAAPLGGATTPCIETATLAAQP